LNRQNNPAILINIPMSEEREVIFVFRNFSLYISSKIEGIDL